MDAGRRRCARSDAMSGARPAFSASRRWAYHSYCELQWRAVMRIANSFSRGGSELLKRMYSPILCARSASCGLRSSALNGPRTPPRGPPAISSYTLRWASFSSPTDSGLKRGASCANAAVASETSAAASAPRYAFMSLSSRDSVYGNVHQGHAVHRSRRPREVARGRSGSRRRHAAGDALRSVSIRGLPAAPQPGGVSQPVALHAQAAVGVHPGRRDGDRPAGRQHAPVQAGRAFLFERHAAGRRELRSQAARPLERPARQGSASVLSPMKLYYIDAVQRLFFVADGGVDANWKTEAFAGADGAGAR